MTEKQIEFNSEALELLGNMLAYTKDFCVFVDSETKKLRVMHIDSTDPEEALESKVLMCTAHMIATKGAKFGVEKIIPIITTLKWHSNGNDLMKTDKVEYESVSKALEYLLYLKEN